MPFSWLWNTGHLPAGGSVHALTRTVNETAANRAQLVLMVHILRRRRCGVVLTPLFR